MLRLLHGHLELHRIEIKMVFYGKNKIKIGFIVITIVILISLNLNEMNVLGSFPGEFYEGENFTWKIDSINEGNNMWYNVSNFNFIANWYANISDEISFSIEGLTTLDNEDFLIGDLVIGNLSIKTNNKDIAYNLAISAYPWYGGLLSLEPNWVGLESITPFNESESEITYDQKIPVLGQLINSVKISYEDAFQETILYYDSITGILLLANTTSGSFNLDLHLTYSSMPLPTVTEGLSFHGLIPLIIGLGAMVILIRMQRKAKWI